METAEMVIRLELLIAVFGTQIYLVEKWSNTTHWAYALGEFFTWMCWGINYILVATFWFEPTFLQMGVVILLEEALCLLIGIAHSIKYNS